MTTSDHRVAATDAATDTVAPRSAANLLSGVCWLVLVTVMFGGYSLLGLLTSAGIGPFEEQFFRAGHAHAGILTAVGILFAQSAAAAGLTYRAQVVAFCVYFAGTLLLSGSFFVHMLIGTEGRGSFGTSVMAPVGALVLAAAIVYVGVRLIRSRS